ncbi:chemotaxis protein CheB [Thiocystis minor]|uniref:chemotaxis protein CheB n=1 Tax=Thiocystis minor TaxID=61597 RepID=UPI0030B8EE6A
MKQNAQATPTVHDVKPDDAPVPETDETPPEHFLIVGIGASVGGLAAFEAFFSGMPADTDPDMAFVLVQHLAPDHKSILSDLIRRYTRMRVSEVEDGMVVRPNCAYIIPPNRDMAACVAYRAWIAAIEEHLRGEARDPAAAGSGSVPLRRLAARRGSPRAGDDAERAGDRRLAPADACAGGGVGGSPRAGPSSAGPFPTGRTPSTAGPSAGTGSV